MKYEDLTLDVMRLLRPMWSRVIAFDLETDTRERKFLINERILAISMAYREHVDILSDEGICVKTLFLEEETDDSEVKLLTEFGRQLDKVRPLGVLGYMTRSYDLPLMAIKKERYKGDIGIPFPERWKIIDFIEQTVQLDLYFVLKTKGYRSLEEVLAANEFAQLPLKRAKGLVESKGDEKAEEI